MHITHGGLPSPHLGGGEAARLEFSKCILSMSARSCHSQVMEEEGAWGLQLAILLRRESVCCRSAWNPSARFCNENFWNFDFFKKHTEIFDESVFVLIPGMMI